MKQEGRHHIAAAWNGKQFRIKIDGLAFQTCNVKTAVVSPPSHAHAFLFFVREGNAVRGRVKPGPSSISPSAQPLCPLCSFDSQVLSEMTCCLFCHTWFCSNHGGACEQCGHIDLCAACLLHHVCLRPEDSVDVVGGAGKCEGAQTFHGFMVQDDGHFCRYLPMDKFGEPMVRKFLDAYNAAVWYFCGIHNGDLEVLLTSLNDHPALPADLLGHILLFCLRSGRCPEAWVPFALLGGILSHARLSCRIYWDCKDWQWSKHFGLEHPSLANALRYSGVSIETLQALPGNPEDANHWLWQSDLMLQEVSTTRLCEEAWQIKLV